MKKISILTVLFLLASALLPALTYASPRDPQNSSQVELAYLGPQGKVMALSDLVRRVVNQKSNEVVKSAQEQAQEEASKAADSLKALIKAYPELAGLLTGVLNTHRDLVRFALEQTDDRSITETLTRQFEYLYEDVALLEQEDVVVAAQVKQMIRHEYWLSAQNRLVSFENMKSIVYNRLASQSVSISRHAPDWYKNL